MSKKRFLYSHGYRDKKWGKKRMKQFVLKHTNSAAKIVGIKIVGQSAKKRFLYSHESGDQEMREKIRAKQLFQNHTNSASKKKKSSGKSAKKRFLYSHEYRDPKGGKTSETRFPETHE